jgi:hypothetical protein
LWYKINKIDPIYAQFLAPKQAKEIGLTPVVTETRLVESAENLVAVNLGTDQTEEMSDGDTVIFMIPLLDSRSELPGHYHNPHKLP